MSAKVELVLCVGCYLEQPAELLVAEGPGPGAALLLNLTSSNVEGDGGADLGWRGPEGRT